MEFEAFFAAFEREGKLVLPGVAAAFRDCSWAAHPAFAGVELKQIVMAEQTQGRCSFYLVRIAPHKKIGTHVHASQWETHEVIAGEGRCVNGGVTLPYAPGTISVFPANVPHAVTAGERGLYLFAKFMPASS